MIRKFFIEAEALKMLLFDYLKTKLRCVNRKLYVSRPVNLKPSPTRVGKKKERKSNEIKTLIIKNKIK